MQNKPKTARSSPKARQLQHNHLQLKLRHRKKFWSPANHIRTRVPPHRDVVLRNSHPD
jgi:hypothetical protein